MKILRLKLGPKLSHVSWLSIEIFSLSALFFLPFSKSVSEITLLVALVLWILRKYPWDERWPDLKPLTIAYALFLIFALLSLTHVPHEYRDTALRGVWKWSRWLATFFMFYELALDPKRVRRLIFTFLLSMGLLCLNGAYQMFSGLDLVKKYSINAPGRFIRLKSSLGSPNSLACFLSMALPMTFYLWLKEKSWSPKSILLVLGVVVFAVGFLSTLSRAAVFALILAVLMYLLLHRRFKIFLAAVISVPLLFFTSKLFFSNFVSSLNLKDITIGERFRFWSISWDMILRHPFLGNGINMYYQNFGNFAPTSETYRGYAHNCYLQMWSEVGIFGLAAFLWPLFYVFSRKMLGKSSYSYNLNSAIGLSISAYLIQAFFDTHFYSFQAATLFWMFWGVYVGLENKDVLRYNPIHKSN